MKTIGRQTWARLRTPSAQARVPIAFVMASFEPGGTERQMIELVRRLDRSRWDVSIVSLRPDGRWLNLAADVARVYLFPITSFARPAAARQMRRFARWCREKRISIVHTVDLPSNVFGLPAAALARVPVRIGNRRDVNPGKTVAQLGLQRLAYQGAHKVVANCIAAADRLRLERVPPRKIAVIHNGIDASRFYPRERTERGRRIVAVGNLRPEKGHETLIDAAALVLREFPDAHFEILGDGPLRSQLADRAASRHISHAVTFAGHCDDVAGRLSMADVFVLPSLSEAFPNAVLEAMAAGLPIVASKVGGVPELIEHGRTGLLAVPGDSADVAKSIGRLLGDPSSATRLARAAREEVVARYSFDRMVSEFERLYVSELSRRRVLHAPQLFLDAAEHG